MDEYDLAEIVRHVIKLNALLIATEPLVQTDQTEASTVNSQVQRISRLPYNTGARRPHPRAQPLSLYLHPLSSIGNMSDVIRFTNGYLAMSDGQVSHLINPVSFQAELPGN